MSSRKLQQEFDKLQKKVAEGLQQFEEIYEKVGTTENPSLKDKLEGDLRKEIKKLQRSRDQVKQWLGDSGNKLDKNVLQDSRSRIENAMERFKEVEKVSKMKQFSNEGLELQTKLGARGADEAKKNEASKYIIETLEELGRQNELLSAEASQYSHKKKSHAIQAVLEDLASRTDRNNGHIAKLELVLRNLENRSLAPEKIDDIKDDLDYYVENNSSSDFVEYDDFYDLLELDDNLEVLPSSGQAPAESASSTASPKKAASTAEKPEAKDSKQDSKPESKSDSKQDSKPEPKAYAAPATAPSTATQSNAPSSTPLSAVLAASASAAPATAPAAVPTKTLPPGLSTHSKPGTPVQVPAKLTVAEELKKKAMAASASSSPAPSAAAVIAQSMGLTGNGNAAQTSSPSPVMSNDVKPVVNNSKLAALTQSRLSNPLPFSAIKQKLEASLLNCPDSFDSERPRQYNPTNVHPSSVDYPQDPMFELNSASIMKKFDTDTLFFCFYYNETQDSLSKYNAAKELSRRGWVFNVETKQWFCKDERPKSRTAVGADDKEAASYKYFDYQTSWLVRRKDNFELKAEMQRTF